MYVCMYVQTFINQIWDGLTPSVVSITPLTLTIILNNYDTDLVLPHVKTFQWHSNSVGKKETLHYLQNKTPRSVILHSIEDYLKPLLQ